MTWGMMSPSALPDGAAAAGALPGLCQLPSVLPTLQLVEEVGGFEEFFRDQVEDQVFFDEDEDQRPDLRVW